LISTVYDRLSDAIDVGELGVRCPLWYSQMT
jgi:hypothetical protein